METITKERALEIVDARVKGTKEFLMGYGIGAVRNLEKEEDKYRRELYNLVKVQYNVLEPNEKG